MKKTLLIAAAASVLLAFPVLAQTQVAQNQKAQAQQQKKLPRLFVGQGIIEGHNVYDCTGKYLGTDPDPNVRANMLKEGDESCKSGY
jgi:hypothetical protein